jgi:hypothetical protein
MSHTPGPWMLGGRHRLPDDENGGQWGYTVKAVGSTAVEQVLGATFHVAAVGANPGDAECEANARLIAAAPELLAALLEMRDAFTSDGTDIQHNACRMADAAIQKAGGE